MQLFIFKTDINTIQEVRTVNYLFNNHTTINKWSLDIEDIDNVLRIEARENLLEQDVISLINACGFKCEILE